MNKTNLPLISIIIPYYNSRFDFFKEAIESVLAQSYTTWEVIIVDDGSTLKSKNKLTEYINKINDKRVSIIHLEKNCGTSVARNKGIALASGEIITFLDSDDILLPWYCHKILDSFSNTPKCSILFSHCIYFLRFWKRNQMWTNESFFELFKDTNNSEQLLANIKYIKGPMAPNRAFKKDVFKKIYFDPKLTTWEDTDLDLQILSNKELLNDLKVVPLTGYLYRLYLSNKRVSNKLAMTIQAEKEIITKYKNKEGTFGSKLIKHWQSYYDDFKFCEITQNYLTNGSILNYLQNAFNQFKSLKDKMKSIRFIITTILNINYIIPLLGCDSRELKMLMSKGLLCSNKNNRYKEIKEEFQEYLNTYKDKEAYNYANKILRKIFTK